MLSFHGRKVIGDVYWCELAGLVSVELGEKWFLHLGVGRNHWFWGHKVEEYDSILDYWGFGPLFLLVRFNR